MKKNHLLRKRTRIICTLGPATFSTSIIGNLIRHGMNVARLNLAHGTYESHAAAVSTIRSTARRLGVDVAVIMDLPGPKYRIGRLEGGSVTLKKRAKVMLTVDEIQGNETLLPVNLPGLMQDVKVGDTVLLDDGALRLKILQKSSHGIRCRVVVGGVLTAGRGLVIPGMPASGPFVTPALREQIAFCVKQQPTYLALSFVSSAADITAVRNLLLEQGSNTPLIAKIERVQAVREFDSILQVSDGIMVARGDLGVDIPLERVPLVQKEIIDKCNRAGKPVITATQMLESMVNAARPTRAEVTDVANAIFDGTDAVMLSAETSIGKYPLAALKMMSKVAMETEKRLPFAVMLAERSSWTEPKTDELISYNACYTAAALGAKAIVAYTRSGSTGMRVSRYRPRVPVIGITPDPLVGDRLLLYWGVYPVFVGKVPPSADLMFSGAVEQVCRLGLARLGDLIVITGGLPVGIAGATNFLKVEKIQAAGAEGCIPGKG